MSDEDKIVLFGLSLMFAHASTSTGNSLNPSSVCANAIGMLAELKRRDWIPDLSNK